MRRLVPLLVVALLALGTTAPTGVAVRGATLTGSPAAAACIAPPPAAATPAAKPGTPAAMGTEAAIGVEPGDEALLGPTTPPVGTPAGESLLERLRAAEENLAACFNAGEFFAFVALFTPKALLAELGMRDPRAAPTHDASYVLLRGEVVSVGDAQTHADGRLSVDVVFAFEGERRRTRDLFVETDGWLLLDEVIELPLASATRATPTPLAEVTLQGLAILGFAPDVEPHLTMVATLGAAIGLPPGGAVALVLGVFDYEVCGIGNRCFVPVPARATWSLSPADGARIDPTTGLLTVDPTTPDGSRFTVRAEVESGRHAVETEVYVFTPQTNPLVGYWREEAQLPCDGGTEVVPALSIEELVFAADGTFAVTWTPFESYVDYWGTYTLDLTRGTLTLTVTGGNDIPPDVDGQGRVALDAAGRLLLTELWLGTSRSGSGPPHCGHRFVR